MEAPERIYLQAGKTEDDDDWDDELGVTWCVDKINHCDVEYVQIDRVIELIGQALGMSKGEARGWMEDNNGA